MEQNIFDAIKKEIVDNNATDADLIAKRYTPEEIAEVRKSLADNAQGGVTKKAYHNYGSAASKDNYGRTRNLLENDKLELMETYEEKTQNNRPYTRWRFLRNGKVWSVSEGTTGLWVKEYYPQFEGDPAGFYAFLQSKGVLVVKTTKMVQNDWGNDVQCVEFA